jgi:hypothetical protein
MVYFVNRFGGSAAALAMAKRPLSMWWALYQLRTYVFLYPSDYSLALSIFPDTCHLVEYLYGSPIVL